MAGATRSCRVALEISESWGWIAQDGQAGLGLDLGLGLGLGLGLALGLDLDLDLDLGLCLHWVLHLGLHLSLGLGLNLGLGLGSCSHYTSHQNLSTRKCQGLMGARHSAQCQWGHLCFIRAWIFIHINICNEVAHQGTWWRSGNTRSIHVPLNLAAAAAWLCIANTKLSLVTLGCTHTVLSSAAGSGLKGTMQDAKQSCSTTASSTASGEW